MNEIKIRAWDKENKNMYYDVGLLTEKGKDRLTISSEGIFIGTECKQFELMLYTGIKDKENNEVYEDDIVEGLVMVQNDLIAVRGLIKFIHGRFVIAEHNCSLYKFSNALGNESNEITKIGNKHENPELLNK